MRRTDEEFSAEVMRRRDEYYKNRKKKMRTVVSICVPLSVFMIFFSVAIIPAMMSASHPDNFEKNPPYYDFFGYFDISTDDLMGVEIYDSLDLNGDSSTSQPTYDPTPPTDISNTEKDDAIKGTENEKAKRVFDVILGIIETETPQKCEAGEEKGTVIVFSIKNGETLTVLIGEDFLYCNDAEWALSPEKRADILSVIESLYNPGGAE